MLHARVGETVEEIRSRHGAGKEVGASQIVFTIDDFDVTISFEKNRSVMEIYTPHLGNDSQVREMKLSDVQKLLDLQGQGKSWIKSEEDAGGKALWLSADGKLYARFLAHFNTLTFAPSLKELPKS
ncbi:MAG: hypothetical protein V4507_13395 [Verrucomicrobiota bacterium]